MCKNGFKLVMHIERHKKSECRIGTKIYKKNVKIVGV